MLPETLRSIPSTVIPDEPDETLDDFEGVELEIRATDLDSLKRGWAARLPSISDRRMPLQIDGGVDTSKLAGGKAVKGDVTVVFRREEGKNVPRRAYLRKLTTRENDGGKNSEGP